MEIIKAKDFRLRSYKKGDEESLAININDETIHKYTCKIPYPYTEKDAKKWIKHCYNIGNQDKINEINFAIDINGEVIGGIGLKNIENNKGEMGYWIGKGYRKKGITTQAVSLVSEFGFKELKLKKITAPIHPKNKASARVLEKNNFKCRGLVPKEEVKDCKFDVLMYVNVK